MHPSYQVNLDVVDSPPVSPRVSNVYGVDLHAVGQWSFSDIHPSHEGHVCSSLRVGFTVTHDNCIEYSVDEPKTAAGVFKLALHGLVSNGAIGGVNGRHSTIWSSEAQLKLVQRQNSSPFVELESVYSEASRPEASPEAASRQLSTCQVGFVAAGSKCDQSRGLFDVEAQKCQNIEETLAEM